MADFRGRRHDDLVNKLSPTPDDTIAAFRDAGVLPDMVQIGNEITRGMLRWPAPLIPSLRSM